MLIGCLDQFNFHHALAETEGSSLVFFTSPACGSCKQLKRMFEQHQDEFGEIQLFEVDAQREMALTNEFNVFHLPAMFLYHDGEFHADLHAEPTARAILAAINAALSQPAMEAP